MIQERKGESLEGIPGFYCGEGVSKLCEAITLDKMLNISIWKGLKTDSVAIHMYTYKHVYVYICM